MYSKKSKHKMHEYFHLLKSKTNMKRNLNHKGRSIKKSYKSDNYFNESFKRFVDSQLLV